MENCLAAAPDDPFRGHDGPLVLERGPAKGPLFDAFFEAVQQAGYPLTDDVNGYRQEGFATFDRNVHNGRRLSAARAYLHPVMNRPNLTVETRAFTTRILFEGNRAIGVEYARRGRGGRTVRAGEVIVCGGAINSPQLLQLSGIGAASDLGALGIDVVADLAGRGREPPGPPRGLRAAQLDAAGDDGALLRDEAATARGRSSGCSGRPARARRTTSRPAASCAGTTR